MPACVNAVLIWVRVLGGVVDGLYQEKRGRHSYD